MDAPRMNNFVRAMRLALRHRWTCASSVVCAVLVAVLWGGNIGAVYPFVEVVFQRKSLQDWLKEQISTAQTTTATLTAEIAEIDQQLATATGPERNRLEAGRDHAASRLTAERQAIARYQWLQPHVDRWLPDDPFQTLVVILGLLMLGTAVKCVFQVAHSILANRLALLATFDLRKLFYRRTLRMELGAFTADGAGELMSRFTYDMENVCEGLNSLFGKAVREPLKMAACLIGAACICWRLLVLSLIIVPLAAWLVDRLAKALKRANRRAMEEMSTIYGLLEETFQGIKVVKAFTMESSERARFHLNSKKFFRKSLKIVRYESLTRPMVELLGMLTICLALIAGAYLVLAGETHLLGIRMSSRPLSLGSILVFYGLLAGASDPARKLSEIFGRLQRASAASDRIFALLDREPLIRDPRQPTRLSRHRKEIVISGVNFHYVPSVPVLEDIELRVPFGETIAIVGPNGCGKSTLVNLLPRFFDPVAGRIELDGVDLRQTRLRDLRAQIGLVTQETLLFDDTVYNNIRYGSPGATREQVLEAAERAKAHRFIEDRLENGYETFVGSRGNLISGGQRQRIALARAILRDPAILILDEATSQIDLESEQVIHKVLEQFVHNRTTFIITHRLSTLALADRVVVMGSGRILDIGTHDQLMRRCDLYVRLHDIQFGQTA
jgi:subfamily B ATP-binding cassette protein MsbA